MSVAAQIHLGERDLARFVAQLVIEVEGEENGQPHVGNQQTLPVQMGVQHQLGVLTDDDEDTQAEREQRAEGEPNLTDRKSVV